MKHQEHIVCIKSDRAINLGNGTAIYDLSLGDLMLGQRERLENDEEFRQVLPISVFIHQGSVWAYERTKKGGETRLHNKIAIAVGGHWDMSDIVIRNGVIDLPSSLDTAIKRELDEEIRLTSNIINSYRLPFAICSDETEVDRVHLGLIWVHELDGTGIEAVEDQLHEIGFVSPLELLNGKYNLETWAKIICHMIMPAK